MSNPQLVLDPRQPQRFTDGDTIRIGIEFQDQSGVDEVYALFVNAQDQKHTIGLRGNGDGGTRLRISLEAQEKANLVPGEYRCSYIHVRDVHGNYVVSYPDLPIGFLVDKTSEAYEPRGLAS